MRMERWARLLLAAAPLLAGCGDFWQAPGADSSTSFALTNGGNISVAQNSSGTSTITVTPGSSFTGTVALTCAVTAPSNAVSPTTCSLSSSSLSFSSAAVQTSTLTATTSSNTTLGTYDITVTGVSGSLAATTVVCAEVGTGTCSVTASTSGIFYVLNQQTSQIAGYSIVKGTLTSITGSPYSLPAPPASIAIAPNGKFLYVGTITGGIYLYAIGSGGALSSPNSTTTANANYFSQDDANTMQVVSNSTNSWLVEAGPNAATLYAIAINPSTGALASSTELEQPVPLPAVTVKQLAVSPDNSNVFVALGNTGTVVVPFNVTSSANPFGTASSAITPAGGTTNGSALSVAVDPNKRLFYIGEVAATSGSSNTGGVRAFNYASLPTISEVTASAPYASGGLAPYSILPTADGNYVYVANRTVTGSATGNIAAFTFTSASGTYSLTALGNPVSAGSFTVGLAEDSTSSYILAVNFGGSPDLGGYTMSSGALTSAVTSATGTDPVQAVAIAALP